VAGAKELRDTENDTDSIGVSVAIVPDMGDTGLQQRAISGKCAGNVAFAIADNTVQQ
jgi:hypothetical protein